jgi:hypothetical protein
MGIRSKAINDSNIKSIYYRETPQILFTTNIESVSNTDGAYRVIQMPNMEAVFSISAQGKSAKEKLNELIY